MTLWVSTERGPVSNSCCSIFSSSSCGMSPLGTGASALRTHGPREPALGDVQHKTTQANSSARALPDMVDVAVEPEPKGKAAHTHRQERRWEKGERESKEKEREREREEG